MDLRNPRLKKIFDDVVSGDRELDNLLIPQFIRSISTHPDAATCLHSLITSEHGLKAIQTVVSSDLSAEYLNGDVAALLAYLRDSKLEHLGGGDTLQRLLRALVDAPGFWSSLVTAFSARQLQQSTERSFSWLFFQLVVSPPEIAEKYRHEALDTSIIQTLLRSPDPETRSNARKINHIVSLYLEDAVVPPDWLEAPGWRHNNDPQSYCQISILPTPDEINSTERPCLKTVDEIDDLGLTRPIKMFEVHVENQFRLLREDLVHDTRENVQVALGNKKGKRTGELITDLFLTDVYIDDKSKWGLEFTCSEDLPFFSSGTDEEDRRHRLMRDRNYLRHGSFACLVFGNEIVAFVTIIRDVDLLARDPPSIAVQLEGRSTIKDTLYQLRRYALVSLVQINTPLFAYEPVLRSLQAMIPTEFLLDGTLLVKPHRTWAAPGNLSDTEEEDVPALIRDLPPVGSTQKPIILDDQQTKAFICGLTQKAALIQGPPGIRRSPLCVVPLCLLTRYRDREIFHRSHTCQSVAQVDQVSHCGLLLHKSRSRPVSRRSTEAGDPARGHSAPGIESFTHYSKHDALCSSLWSVRCTRLGGYQRNETLVGAPSWSVAACVLRVQQSTEPLGTTQPPQINIPRVL